MLFCPYRAEKGCSLRLRRDMQAQIMAELLDGLRRGVSTWGCVLALATRARCEATAMSNVVLE